MSITTSDPTQAQPQSTWTPHNRNGRATKSDPHDPKWQPKPLPGTALKTLGDPCDLPKLDHMGVIVADLLADMAPDRYPSKVELYKAASGISLQAGQALHDAKAGGGSISPVLDIMRGLVALELDRGRVESLLTDHLRDDHLREEPTWPE